MSRYEFYEGDPAGTSGYLGSKDFFDKGIRDFAVRYADQTENDHQALVEAVKSGRITTETDL